MCRINIIERKSLLWPPNAAEIHRAEHRFWRFLISEIGKINLPDYSYSLYIDTTHVVRDSELLRMAKTISSWIDLNRHSLATGGLVSGIEPLRFAFSLGDCERGAPTSGITIHTDEHEFDDLKTPASVPALFSASVNKFFQSATEKFSTYADCTKVLLLNFTSANLYDYLDSDWWSKYLEQNLLPPCVDELWSSLEYEPSRWSFTQLHPKIPDLGLSPNPETDVLLAHLPSYLSGKP